MNEKDLIKKMQFLPKEKTTGVFYKTYKNGYTIEVDFEKNSINYGEKIKSDSKTTQNFSQAENFVVLECVDRLLEKGYKAEDITLEKTYPCGHGHSGRLDILVSRDVKAFLMIECKTWSKEFSKEFSAIAKNGGQLFTYFQNDTNTDYLMLYTSRISDGKVEYKSEIIKIENSYRNAGNVEDVYNRWNKITYNNGIFDAHVEPYTFQNKLLTLTDLKPLTVDDSGVLFHGFASILRKHSVSDKPNAFNKIFNLFLAKIYDEGQCDTDKKRDTAALDFQWKEGSDTDEDFQIRLINLHKEGVKLFLEKEIEGLSEEEITLQQTADKQGYKRKWLKFNKIFDIKDVNDDESFDDNARVLKEVVALLAQYQIRYPRRQQHLSDFFERLLTTGLKQEAGQYFTPVPIARFIAYSLPLEKMIIQEVNQPNPEPVLPAVIDYAAGSGHFLTELLEIYQDIINKLDTSDFYRSAQGGVKAWQVNPYSWALKYIYGVEKDYRLVKVAKIGCYFYGDGLAQVIHGDGLDNFCNSRTYRGLLKKNKDAPQFSVVVSNPPYSVEAFKGDLRNADAKDDFTLFPYLTDRSSEIECLFVERMVHLLKAGGVAGIILPSSLLSNTGIYTKTREILLQRFEIIAITELGSNTFMATGTNTVVLFLRRRTDAKVRQIIEGINECYNTLKDLTVGGIENASTKYTREIWGVSFDDYITLLNKSPNKTLSQSALYKEYVKRYPKQDMYFNKDTPAAFLDKMKEKYEAAAAQYWENIIALEKEKLLYFILAYYQTVVLVKTGEKDAEKRFLGYEFSNRRGSEGIHPIQRGKTVDECTRLFDEHAADNPQKASTYIYRAFSDDITSEIDASLQDNVSRVRLVDMLVFDRSTFDKTLSTNVKTHTISFEKIWGTNKLVAIIDVAEIKKGTSITKQETVKGNIPVIAGGQEIAYYHNVSNREGNIITISASGAYSGFVNYYDKPIFASDCNTVKSRDEKNISTKLLYWFLKSIQTVIYTYSRGQAQPHVYADDIANIKIPLPPMDIQQKIVAEIEAVEKEEQDAQVRIQELKNEIANKLHPNIENTSETKNLGDVCEMKAGTFVKVGDISDSFIAGLYPCYGGNGLRGYTKTYTHEGKYTLLGRQGALCGNVHLVDGKFHATEHALVVKPKLGIDAIWLYYKLVSMNLNQYAVGTAQPGLSVMNLRPIKIPLPPFPEQQRIAAEIEKIEAEIQRLQKQQEQMSAQKDAILRKFL